VTRTYDACIFGCGPAGSAVAARLSDLGMLPLVLDRPSNSSAWHGESFAGAIAEPLRALDLLDAFQSAEHVKSYEERIDWGGGPWLRESLFRAYGSLWHVDRAQFNTSLREALRLRAVPVVRYRKLVDLRYERERWRIALTPGGELFARFLVDATGRARVVSRRLGVRPRSYDRLVALTASIPRNRDASFDHAMVIAARPDGWWYAAPVPQGHVLTFLTDADLAPIALRAFMRTVAANSSFAQSKPGSAWLAVGDACAAHDPLYGSGTYRALVDGIRAAEAITSRLAEGNSAQTHAFRRRCAEQFQSYLSGLSQHYSYEKRWQSLPFWKRRCAA
jgi:flavin-dependent dehydrogenase